MIDPHSENSHYNYFQKSSSHSPFPQVGPTKAVWEQSQMKRPQPSLQVPPCMQGLEEQEPPSLWQKLIMEPVPHAAHVAQAQPARPHLRGHLHASAHTTNIQCSVQVQPWQKMLFIPKGKQNTTPPNHSGGHSHSLPTWCGEVIGSLVHCDAAHLAISVQCDLMPPAIINSPSLGRHGVTVRKHKCHLSAGQCSGMPLLSWWPKSLANTVKSQLTENGLLDNKNVGNADTLASIQVTPKRGASLSAESSVSSPELPESLSCT
ncbi:hypothetical protein E2C01_022222 [Portunus trituberculatus]|uniref:Uncharacterized protein n=1 Tax=Portunus trituberculatus TaxID=210409 RepID=A0A5B7E723_PORTR|nr:hypothetical protein [Portunus trituberculatus]